MIEYVLLAQMVGSMEHSLSLPAPNMIPEAPTYSWEPNSSAGFTKGWSSSPSVGGGGGGGSVGGGSIFHQEEEL